MPCTDYGRDEEEKRKDQIKLIQKIGKLQQDKTKAEALLCAVIGAVLRSAPNAELGDILEFVDEKECGVTKTQIADWWIDHKAKDEARRAKERAESLAKAAEALREARKEQLRENALAKLSHEEKKALGII